MDGNRAFAKRRTNMAFQLNNSRPWLFALPLVGLLAGCCCEAFPLPGEKNCPTDARRIYRGAGEEAVRRCPCGIDRAYYGHKPTEWRAWPEGWRYGQYSCSTQPIEPAAAPRQINNPFREDPTEI